MIAVLLFHPLIIVRSLACSFPDTCLAKRLYGNAKVNYQKGEYIKSLQSLDSILIIKGKMVKDTTPEYFKIYNLLGVIQKQMGNLKKAIMFYKLAAKNTTDSYYLSALYKNIANVYSLTGDFSKAFSYLSEALVIISSAENKNARLEADIYHNLGYAEYYSGNFREALLNYQKSIRTIKENNLEEDGETYYSFGLVYQQLNRLSEADKCFRKAIICNEKKFGVTHHITAMSYMNYAGFFLDTEDYMRSGRLYEKAYRILKKTVGEKHLYTSYCHKYRGDLYYQLGEYYEALQYYQRALISKIDDFNAHSVSVNPDIDVFPDLDLLDILKAKANAYERISEGENRVENLKKALGTYEITVRFIEKLRTGYLYEKSKLALAEREHDTYLSIIHLTYALMQITGNDNYAKRAFSFSERSKYTVLRELNEDEEAKVKALVPGGIRSREREIRETIGTIRIQIEQENKSVSPDIDRINMLKESLFEQTQELERLTAEMEEEYPEYYNLKYNSKVVEVSVLQEKLRCKQVALEYVLADSLLYTFIVTKEQFKFHKTPVGQSFYYHLDYYKSFLFGKYSAGYDSFRVSAYKLYEALLQPYEDKIANKSLLIIPDEEMALISFEALIDEPYQEREWVDYAYEPYILRKYPIGYAYSASLYNRTLKTTANIKKRVLAFAPGYENSPDSLPVMRIPQRYLRKLTSRGGKLFTGEAATETALKKYSGQYNILQLFVHGYEDTLTPALSRMFFANPVDGINDGYLYAHEINSIQMRADLVVLASCYSGSGQIRKGEGVLSLGRSFLNAGAGSLILSLWTASYDPTIEGLKYFRKYLLMGKRKDEALRLAKLDYLKTASPLASHPGNWSNLILVGNQQPLYTSPFRFIILLVLGGIAAVFALKKIRRNK